MKTIMFDIDGVLADFVLGFTQLAVKAGFMKKAYSTFEQDDWSFRQHLTNEEEIAVWGHVGKIPNWWAELRPLPTSNNFVQIDDLARTNRVYFVTARIEGIPDPIIQSYDWLKLQGIQKPNVIVSSKKDKVADVLNANYCIDDNWLNACSIRKPCKSYILDRQYNRNNRISQDKPGALDLQYIPPIIRVESISEYLTDCMLEK